MSGRVRRWLRPVAGAAILGAVGLRFGADPFLDGLRRVDAAALLVALVVNAATTWCCARRWALLADRLDVPVSLWPAYVSCHRAQFLNAVLPGGVVGDVHRAVRHGRHSGAMGRGLRSVLWDRISGQAVQVGAALAALALLVPPARGPALVALGAGVLGAVLATRAAPRLAAEVVGLSLLATLGHLVVFVTAARTAGVSAPLAELVPLALVVLVGAAIPLSLAGWGPREGVAAWAFAVAGLGGATGVEVTVVFGVMSLVATLPGALVLLRPRRPVTNYDENRLDPSQSFCRVDLELGGGR